MNRLIQASRPSAQFARLLVAASFGCAAFSAASSALAAQARTTLDIHAMRLASEHEGWVAGPTQVLRTSDAGRSWNDATPAVADLAGIEATHFVDANDTWIAASTHAGSLVLAHTHDGGASWAQQTVPREFVADATPLSLHFVDPSNGWLMLRAPSGSSFQRGTLLRTRDGGATWTVLPTPPIIDRLVFVSADTGWLAGGVEHDRLYVTHDGGASWQLQSLPGIAGARHWATQTPRFRNTREGALAVSVDDGSSTHALVYATADGGMNWHSVTMLPLSRELDATGVALAPLDWQALVLAPQGSGLALHKAGILNTVENQDLPQGGTIVALDFTSDTHGWLLERHGTCADFKAKCRQETRLFATNDGGQGLLDITPAVAGDVAPDSVFISHNHKGFDQCAAGTVSQMQAWWTSTPWSDANIYIGGENSACDSTNDARLTPAWIKAVLAQGWHLIPTWVGKQAPTSGCGGCSKLSTDPVTARTQGIAEANAAQAKARSIGLQTPTVIYYDMEGYNGSSAAAAAFLDGWTARMHELGNTSGIYGGASNASTDWYPLANRADAVWIAAWNGQASVFGLSGLADSKWDNQQRIHQFQGGHDETWNGVTFNIDSNYEDGPVAAVDCIFCDGFE